MTRQELILWLKNNLIDIEQINSGLLPHEGWVRCTISMPIRLDENEPYKCINRSFFELLRNTMTSSTNLFILNYLVYGSELDSERALFWEVAFDWNKISEIMDQQYSHLGLCIWDSAMSWCITSIDDEYLVFCGEQSVISNVTKSLKTGLNSFDFDQPETGVRVKLN